MKEELFKAKRKDNGEWIQGSLLVLDDGSYRIATSCLVGDVENVLTVCAYDVDPDTICQYTGLTDKNGNKIWENDVVHNGNRFIVKWNEECARFDIVLMTIKRNIPIGKWEPMIIDWKAPKFVNYRTSLEIEVIGNIFDNKELLEGGETDE